MDIRLRQDAILRRLRRGGMDSIEGLAEAVGVSRRTVLRDIGALREQGYVIDSEAGRGGGLWLDPQSVQTASRLTVVEVFALMIGVAAMRAAGSLPFGGLADAGLAKIEKSLPADRVRDLRRLLACLHVGTLSPLQDLSDMGRIDPALLPAFETAFLDRHLLRFHYRDANGAETDRIVEPQALLILPPLWYLVAWDAARGDFRHFRMDRITAPAPVDGLRFRRRVAPFAADVCPYRDLPR